MHHFSGQGGAQAGGIALVAGLLAVRRQQVGLRAPGRPALRRSVERDLQSADPIVVAVGPAVPVGTDRVARRVVDVRHHVDVEESLLGKAGERFVGPTVGHLATAGQQVNERSTRRC